MQLSVGTELSLFCVHRIRQPHGPVTSMDEVRPMLSAVNI